MDQNPQTLSAAPPPVIQTKINTKQTFLIGLGFLSCMLAWMVYNYQMPLILAGKISEDGETFIRVGLLGMTASRQFWSGVIMTLDNIVAIALQPKFGEMSDRLHSKYGRRTPFMLIGIPIAAVALIVMPFASKISVFAVAVSGFLGIVVIFNLAMAFYRAPIVSLLPDMTPAKFRSTGNAIINLMGGLGTAFGFLVPILFSGLSFVKDRVVVTGDFATQDYFMEDFMIFFSTAILIVIVLILFMLFVKEVPTGTKFWELGKEPIMFDPDTLKVIPKSDSTTTESKPKNSIWQDLIDVFQEKEKSGVYILLAIFAWFFGYNALEANFSRWTQEFLLLRGGLVGQLFLGLPVALIIVGIPAAKIAERAGRRKTIKIGLVLMILSLTVMVIVQELLRNQVIGGDTPNIWGLAFCIALMGVGWALININSITIVWQLSPKEKLGAYTGLYYLFSQLAAIISPIFMGFLLMIGELIAGPVLTWRSLVPFMAISMCFALFFMGRVKRGEVEYSAEELKQLEEKFAGSD
jgi:MFS family permease